MSPNLSNRPKNAQAAELAPIASVAVEKLPVLDASPGAPVPVKALREALAAVVTAVEALERKETFAPKSVDLQLRVGDESLALRVELRDGTVHTTFRAQSAELRSALAQEWQSVVPPAVGREIRMADPVFNAAPAGQESAFGSPGQGASHHRGQPAPEAAAFSFAREFSDSSEPAPGALATAPAPNSASLLNTFA